MRAVAGQTAVYKTKLWSGEKDPYAQSIQWEMAGNYSAVVHTDYKYAQEIESDRPPKDLKKMLDTSQKVRRTTDGRRFLVIPMRHNTGGSHAGIGLRVGQGHETDKGHWPGNAAKR